MGISLTGLTPATTYDALIKVGDNGPITGALKVLSDGLGTNLPMEASTTGINFTGTLTQAGTTLQPTLVSGTNIKTINGTTILGSGNIVTPQPSGVAGAIQFSNGSAFASDATNLFWDDTNNRLGIRTNSPTATTHIVGVDQLTTSTSLLVQDSVGGNILRVHNSANNSAVVMSTAKIADYDIISGNVLSNTQMRFVPTTGGIAVNKDYSFAASNTLVHLKGSGSTSATTSLLVQNSAGTATLTARDDGKILIRDYIAGVGENAYLRLNNSNGFEGGYNEGSGGSFQAGGSTVNLNIGGNKILQGYLGGISIGKGAVNPVASAQLEVVSTTKGFLPPVMNTTQKNAIATPATGLIVMDITTFKLCVYNGTSWVDLH
jgi:hypothetical protein